MLELLSNKRKIFFFKEVIYDILKSVDQKENYIWHIDDDGNGKEVSKQNKFKGEPSLYQSNGIHLTQSRLDLDLDNALNKRNATLETDKKDAAGN
jgi:hypothetical protein